MGGLVYEGRVTLPEEHETLNLNTGAEYCDYREAMEQAAEAGIDFHLYPGREDEAFTKTYDKALLHPGYEYRNLLRQISRHDWGLVGNTVDSPQWQQTLPNKLFDYLAAGVPSVCINAGASSRIVKEYGIGITVNNLSELADRWSEHRDCRNRLLRNRKQLSMEAHINDLLKLYGGLV
jgi:glycosyltransferase involved in cell wall biosynthesis